MLENDGYQPCEGAPVAAITARADTDRMFSAWVRTHEYSGRIVVALVDAEGIVVTQASIDAPNSDQWQCVEAVLPASRDARVFLRLTIEGSGSLDLDDVSLSHADYWGAGDPRWSQGRLRRDLVEALRDLHPTFLRFPGGFVVEGSVDAARHYIVLVNALDRPVDVELSLPLSATAHADLIVLRAALDAVNRLAFTGDPVAAISPVRSTVLIDAVAVRISIPTRSICALSAPLGG